MCPTRPEREAADGDREAWRARAAGSKFLQLRPGSTMVSVIQDFSIHESYWDTYFEAAPKAGIPLGDVGALEAADLKKVKTNL